MDQADIDSMKNQAGRQSREGRLTSPEIEVTVRSSFGQYAG